MLDRLELFNFKSYAGHQTLGPFRSFTAVIGPNGAGKSNLMDAISFVLGVRSASLRSAALKDLVYRSGSKKGKGKEKVRENGEESSGEEESGEEEGDGERKAYVIAVYIDGKGKEWRFQRSISTAGASEYKLNGKAVAYKKYNETLEGFNILVKAKNFLVFQGDVEAVASQSPKDLAKLIDQISGSLDLKETYDAAASALAKATETSVAQHSRRKGVNGEIKQYKEMKKEAERFRALESEKEQAVVQHLLWKLFHIEEGIRGSVETIEAKNEALDGLRAENAQFEEAQKAAKKEVAKAQKEATRQEKLVHKREKELEENRPALDAIEAKLAHAAKKLKAAESNAATVEHDLEKGETKLATLETDLADVKKAAKRHDDTQAKIAKSKGITLGPEDLKEYRDLKATANTKAVSERQSLATLHHEEKTQRDALNAAQDSLEVSQRKMAKLEVDEAGLSERKATTETKVKQVGDDLKNAKNSLDDAQRKKVDLAQTEAELNEKLVAALQKIQQAGVDKQESERDAKFRETLANLKRTFPGVKGRVIDLCKPTHSKYSIAVTTILGRNIDSVVVDNEKTAIACIEYMRVQRAGQATFVPLETIQAKAVNDKFRSFAKGARLAIDVIQYDPSVERAMQHACGNALVCDTMEIARHVCYDKGQEVKAVTLEGTIIHRSGLITGGTSARDGQGRQFEEREVDVARARATEAQAKLQEIHRNRPRAGVEDTLVFESTRLESELRLAKDDLAATIGRLSGVTSELKVLKKTVAGLHSQVTKTTSELEAIEEKALGFQAVVDAEEDSIFAAFCRRIKVANIREYEQKQLRGAQEDNEARLKFDTQMAKLSHQVDFNGQQVQGIRDRLATLHTAAATERANLTRLQEEKETTSAELVTIEGEIEELKETLVELQEVLGAKNVELDEVRKKGGNSARVLDKAMKEIAACNDEIEKLSSERFAIYRRCKLEEIELPLEKGSLDTISIDAVPAPIPMDVDGEDDGTQRAAEVTNYGVEVDFESLDEEEKEDATDAMEEVLLGAITKVHSEMEKLSPNMKAIERLGDSEARFKEIDGEFDKARQTAKDAKDAFTAIKKERCDLFNKAYNHISDRIDEVYKDLTKGKAAPMGGVAYLSLEDSEEPYLHGIKYHAMPPMKRFRDMDQLSGGEKTMAALALLFAIHSYHPSPFFVLDEVDAALDNTNVSRIARYVQRLANPDFQFLTITLKAAFYEQAAALVGVYRDGGSKTLTLNLEQYAQ